MAKGRALGLFVVTPALVLLASVTGAVATTNGAIRLAAILIGVVAAALLMCGVFYVLRVNARG